MAASLAASAYAVGRQDAAADTSDATLHFMIVGDWGRRGNQDQRRVARAMQQNALVTPPRFVISVGDNFYPRGVSTTSDPLWAEAFENVYDGRELDCPWYAILGNHDHKQSVQAEIDYSRKSRRWKMPAAYYKHTEEISPGISADFFFIDTTPIVSHQPAFWSAFITGSSTKQQITWLEESLRASSARWKIVVGHHPIISAGPHGEETALVREVKPLLEKYGVHAYFNGHEHNLQYAVDSGVHYLTSGAGSIVRAPTRSCATCFAELGFMDASISPTSFVVRTINEQGRVLHVAEIGTA